MSLSKKKKECGQENIKELGNVKEQLFTFLYQILRAETSSLSRVEIDVIDSADNTFLHPCLLGKWNRGICRNEWPPPTSTQAAFGLGLPLALPHSQSSLYISLSLHATSLIWSRNPTSWRKKRKIRGSRNSMWPLYYTYLRFDSIFPRLLTLIPWKKGTFFKD